MTVKPLVRFGRVFDLFRGLVCGGPCQVRVLLGYEPPFLGGVRSLGIVCLCGIKKSAKGIDGLGWSFKKKSCTS